MGYLKIAINGLGRIGKLVLREGIKDKNLEWVVNHPRGIESAEHVFKYDSVQGKYIGKVKIPRWLSNFTGKKLNFEVVSGLNNIPGSITDYALVIQCGGCVLTRKQVLNRLKPAIEAGVPVTNYGMTIAWLQGIYDRAISPFNTNTNKADYL